MPDLADAVGSSTAPSLTAILLRNGQRVASSQLDFSSLQGKTILLTGASGLIGINFLASLLAIAETIKGIKIVPVVQSTPPFFMKPLLEAENVQLFQGDLSDESFLNSLPEADIILHGAGFGQPRRFMDAPLSALRLNSATTLSLFKNLTSGGRFLFISSSDIYNGTEAKQYDETQIGHTNTDHPRACYIEGKRMGEAICYAYKAMGYRSYAIRLSLTYGPGIRKSDQRVLPALIQKGIQGKIELLDSGAALRTFLYVSDAIEIMWYILLHGQHTVYNVGATKQISIRQLAQNIASQLDAPLVLPEHEKGIAGAPNDVLLDMSRLYAEYKKTDFISLQQGLQETIEWTRRLSQVN